MIRVVLVDDQTLVRQGIRSLLELAGDIAIVAEASDGEDGVTVITRERPDVVLLDVRMPRKGGLDVLRELQAAHALPPTILLTTFDDDEALLEGVKSGARGYLLKDVDQEEVIRAVKAVSRGEAIFSPAIAERLIHYFAALKPATADQAFPELTDREREILHLIAQGHSNSTIAERLLLSIKTVQNHVSNIFSKLQVADRAQAIIRARDAGLGLDHNT